MSDNLQNLIELAKRERTHQINDTLRESGEFAYKGDPNKAYEDAQRFSVMGTAAQQRTAPQIDYSRANQARGMQMGAIQMSRAAAMGELPSAAVYQQQRGLDDSIAQQMAAQNSGGRGALGMQQAQMGAAMQASPARLHGMQGAADARAQEIAKARGMYMGGLNQMRGGDVGQMLDQANMDLRQRAANDAFSNAMYSREIGLNSTQLDANLRRAQQAQAQEQINRGQRRSNENTAMNVGGTVVTAGATAAM